MGDLDRRLAGRWLPVEGQQSVAAEGLEDLVVRLPLHVQRVELTAGDAPTGVRSPSPSVTRRRKS